MCIDCDQDCACVYYRAQGLNRAHNKGNHGVDCKIYSHTVQTLISPKSFPKPDCLIETSEWSSHVSRVVSVDKDCASLQVVTHIESLRGEGERGEDEGRR